jgi:hypothetical protein
MVTLVRSFAGPGLNLAQSQMTVPFHGGIICDTSVGRACYFVQLLLAQRMKSGSLVVVTFAEPIVAIAQRGSLVAASELIAEDGVAEPIVPITECRSFVAVAKPFAKDGVAEPIVPITECRPFVAVAKPFAKDGVAEPIVPLEECRSLVAVTEPSVLVASCGLVNGSAGRHLVSGGVWHLVLAIGSVRLVIGRTQGCI